MTTVILVLITCALLVTMYFVHGNHLRSTTNRELIEGNRKIIKQNQTLIALINAIFRDIDNVT